MNEAYAEGLSRTEPGGFSQAVAEPRPAGSPGESGPKPWRLLKLVTATAVMAAASGVLGLLAVALFGRLFGLAAGMEFEAKSWAAIAMGQLLLGALALWRSRKRFGPGWRDAIGLRAVALDGRLAGRIVRALALYWTWAGLIVAAAVLSGALRDLPNIAPGGPAALAAFALATVVLAPLCEEVFFRGYVQARAETFLSPAMSLALPAFLFALAHFSGSLAQPAVVFVMGMLAGRLRRDTGSLIPGIVLHALNNGCLVLLIGTTINV